MQVLIGIGLVIIVIRLILAGVFVITTILVFFVSILIVALLVTIRLVGNAAIGDFYLSRGYGSAATGLP